MHKCSECLLVGEKEQPPIFPRRKEKNQIHLRDQFFGTDYKHMLNHTAFFSEDNTIVGLGTAE